MSITDTDIQFAQGIRLFYRKEGYKPPHTIKIRKGELVYYDLKGQSAVPLHVYVRIKRRISTHGALLYGTDQVQSRVVEIPIRVEPGPKLLVAEEGYSPCMVHLEP